MAYKLYILIKLFKIRDNHPTTKAKETETKKKKSGRNYKKAFQLYERMPKVWSTIYL